MARKKRLFAVHYSRIVHEVAYVEAESEDAADSLFDDKVVCAEPLSDFDYDVGEPLEAGLAERIRNDPKVSIIR